MFSSSSLISGYSGWFIISGATGSMLEASISPASYSWYSSMDPYVYIPEYVYSITLLSTIPLWGHLESSFTKGSSGLAIFMCIFLICFWTFASIPTNTMYFLWQAGHSIGFARWVSRKKGFGSSLPCILASVGSVWSLFVIIPSVSTR